MTQTKATLNECEAVKNRAHNLNLYLDFVRQADKTLWSAMMDEFNGMPGFTEHADGYRPDWMEGADNDVH